MATYGPYAATNWLILEKMGQPQPIYFYIFVQKI